MQILSLRERGCLVSVIWSGCIYWCCPFHSTHSIIATLLLLSHLPQPSAPLSTASYCHSCQTCFGVIRTLLYALLFCRKCCVSYSVFGILLRIVEVMWGKQTTSKTNEQRMVIESKSTGDGIFFLRFFIVWGEKYHFKTAPEHNNVIARRNKNESERGRL